MFPQYPARQHTLLFLYPSQYMQPKCPFRTWYRSPSTSNVDPMGRVRRYNSVLFPIYFLLFRGFLFFFLPKRLYLSLFLFLQLSLHVVLYLIYILANLRQ